MKLGNAWIDDWRNIVHANYQPDELVASARQTVTVTLLYRNGSTAYCDGVSRADARKFIDALAETEA